MLKLQNEKLKALFNWIKSPKSTFFLLLAFTFFCFQICNYDNPYFLGMLSIFGCYFFGISLFINLICISLLEFLLFSILSFIFFCLSAVFIGGTRFYDLGMAILIYGTPIFLSKLIYTLTARSTSSQNLKTTSKIQENLPTNAWYRFFKFLLLYSFIFLYLGPLLNAFLSVYDFSEYGLLYDISRTALIFIGMPVCLIFLPLFLAHLFLIRGIALVTPSPSKIHPIHLCILFLSGLSYFILLGYAILNDVDLYKARYDLVDSGLFFTFVLAIFITSLSAKTALKKRIFMKKIPDVHLSTAND